MGYFDGLKLDEAFKALQPPEPKSPGVLGNLADTGLQLAQGVLQGGEMLANNFGADNPVSKTLRTGAEWLASNFSDQLKWEQLTSAQDQRAAELSGATWEELKAAARTFGRDPVGFLVNAAGTSLPTIAAAFLPGGQGAALGRLAALGMGAAQGAGAVKGQIFNEVEQAWKQAGASDEEAEARATAAQAYLGSNTGQIALGTALGAVAGGTGVEAGILARKTGLVGAAAADAAAVAPTSLMARAAARVPRFAREGVKEALPEAAQGGQEQLAGNVALQNEGFDRDTMQGVAGNALLEGLAGGAFGAATSPLTRAPQAQQQRADQALSDLANAKTADEMIGAATRAVDVPIVPGGIDARAEDRALSAMEQMAQQDANAIRFGNTPDPRTNPLAGVEPQEPSATVTDAPPFGDRVLDLREQLADERTREQIRERLGPEALDTVSYYANVADRADIDLTEKTRERLLGLAEGIVERALFRREGQPQETAGLLAEPQRRIGLDTAPTGAMRVDSAGNVAPETRADAIDTRNRSLRERVDGMVAQRARGQEPRPPAKPDERRAPRTPTAEALDIDITAPNAVAQYVERMRGVNTPTARAFVQGFESGRITRDDVLAVMLPRREASADERLAAAAAQAPADEPGLLLTGDGFPYGTKSGATLRARREGLGADSVIEVPGGYAVRTQEAPSVEPELPSAPAGVPRTGADGSGAADASGGAVRPVAGDAIGRESVDPVAADEGGRVDLPAGDRRGVGETSLTTLKAQWKEAVDRGDTKGAAEINARIVEAKKQEARSSTPVAESLAPAPEAGDAGVAPSPGAAAPATGGDALKPVRTVFGQTVYVQQSDLSGDRSRMMHYTSTGKSLGVILRENLDPDGSKQAAQNAESAGNPLFDTITAKNGAAFATEAAASRERSMRGLGDGYSIEPVRGGFVLRRKKQEAATPPAPNEGAQPKGDRNGQEGRMRQQAEEAAATRREPATVGEDTTAVLQPADANRTLTRAEYEAGVKERTNEFAVGLAGDNAPVSFQQRKMAEDRIPNRLKERFDILATGTGASKRYWVVPTYTEYLRRRGETEPATPEPAQQVAQAEPAETLNKRHSIPKTQVLTPAGSIKAAATDSRAPSSLWYYQGDMGRLQFTAGVTIDGQPDPGADQAKALLEQIKSVQDAGWRRTNYRAGSLGTVWVFERGGEFLTRAGMENADAAEIQRPELSPNKPGFLSMATQQFELAKAFNDWLQTLPEDQQQNRGVVVRKMGETPVGQWARVEDDPVGGVALRYYDKGALQFRISISAKTWPEMVRYVAGLAERFEQSKTADEHAIGVLQREAGADAAPKTLKAKVDDQRKPAQALEAAVVKMDGEQAPAPANAAPEAPQAPSEKPAADTVATLIPLGTNVATIGTLRRGDGLEVQARVIRWPSGQLGPYGLAIYNDGKQAWSAPFPGIKSTTTKQALVEMLVDYLNTDATQASDRYTPTDKPTLKERVESARKPSLFKDQRTGLPVVVPNKATADALARTKQLDGKVTVRKATAEEMRDGAATFVGYKEGEDRRLGYVLEVDGAQTAPTPLKERVEAKKQGEQPGLNDPQSGKAPAPEPTVSKTPTVDAHLELFKAVRAGTATPDEFKAMYRRVRDGKDAIVAELNTSTKDELLKDISGYVRPGTTKGELVDWIYTALLRRFALGKEYGPNSYMMGQEKAYQKAKQDALDALVEGQTAESLAEYAAAAKAEFDAEVARRAALVESVKDPKTLEDFRRYIRVKESEGKTFAEARMMLTPEQRALMDDLSATETRSRRTTAKDEQRTQVRVAGQTVDGEIIATKHTKKGHDLYVVKLAERVSREDYDTLNAGAKRIGGYYSSFRGGGAIPGFQFTTREQAEAFVKLAGGDNAAAQEAAQERRNAYEDDRSQTAAERLTEMADRMEEGADESLAMDRKANTTRRARFAASAEQAAREAKAMAKTMRNIAQALTSGAAKFLDRVRTKTQVELLQTYVANAKDAELRAKYPSYAEQEKRKGQPPTAETADYAEFPSFTAYRSDLASLGRQLLEVDGTKKLGEQIMKVADDVSEAFTAWVKEPGNFYRVGTFSTKDGGRVVLPSKDAAERSIARSGYRGKAIPWSIKRGEWTVIMSPSEAMARGLWQGDGDKRITLAPDFGAELVEKIGRANRRGARVAVPWQFERAHERRKQLARMGLETPAEFRAALREFIGLREQAAEADRIKALERAMVGRAKDGLDFFPTPAGVADEMIAAADIKPEMSVLEPSAGMGHIADRIRAAGAEPDVIELSGDRRELLQEKGYYVQPYNDFLQMELRSFYTFGDVMRAPDGVEGIMRGGPGWSGRASLHEINLDGTEGRMLGWYDRAELVGVRQRGPRGNDAGGYDRIVMNPPFSDGRDIDHVRHAYTLLKPGGRLVALMGESAFTNQNKKATEFREWLESVGGSDEKLAEGSFMDPSLPVNTGANARMVVIEKPESGVSLSRKSEVADAWKTLAKNEDLFAYPKSEATNIEQVARDAKLTLQVEPTPADTLPSDVERAWYVYPPGKDAVLANRGFIIEYKDGRVEANLSRFEEGDSGAQAYVLAGTYAHNNGLVFSGDRLGIKAVGMQRRLEHMISLALKFGSTDFLAPHPDMLKALALDWRDGDGDHNLAEMLLASYRNATAKAPAIKDLVYDTDTDSLASVATGDRLTDDDAARVLELARSAGLPVGRRSLSRLALTATIARGAATTQGRRLAERLREGAAGAVELPSGLRGVQYARVASDGGLRGTDADALRDLIEQSGVENVNVVQSVGDLPANKRDAILAREPSGRVRGAYFRNDDSIWLVADNLTGPSEVAFVLMHEAFHRGLAKTLGADAKRLLRQMYLTNPRLNKLTRDLMAQHGIVEAEAIEEALADLAGDGRARDLRGWDRFMAMIRDWLSKLGDALGVDLRWSDDMIEDFAAGIRKIGLEGGVHVDAGASLSRAPTANPSTWDSIRDAKLPAGYIVNDFIDKHGKLSWWSKTVGTMHNLAQRSPEFKRVYDAVQRFLGDVSLYATEAANEAPTLLPKLETFRDITKSPLSAEDTKAIASPIFEGTLSWARDENGEPVPEDDPQAAGIVWTDDELRQRFKLNGRQIGLYREFRAAVDKSLTDLAISDMLRHAGRDADPVRSQVLASESAGEAATILQEHLAELAETASKDRAATLASTGATIGDKAAQAERLIQRGYAPLTRFGHYTLDVVDENGDRVYFGLFESEAEANRMARKLREGFPGAQVTQGTLSERAYQMFAGVSPETLELFGNLLGLESQGNDAASVAFQEYLKLAKSNRSALKRLIERKGIAGFSEDAGRVLAGFVYSNARQTAKNLHFGSITEATQAIADTKGKGELLDAAVDLHQYVTNPREEAQKIKGLLFAQFLGGSIASAMVNLTQPVAVAFPYLSQWGGASKAARRVTAALKDALAWETTTDPKKRTTGDKALDAAMKRAEEEGIVSPQEVHQLIAQAGGSGALEAGDGTVWGDALAKASNFRSKFMLAWGRPFSLTEQFNRRATYIAAYRTAVEEGQSDPDGFAAQAIADTMFTYNKGNRPAWARGAIGGVLFCVDEATEALTTEGWKNIDTLKAGDLIASFDMKTERMCWKPVESVHQFPFHGDLLHISGKSLDMLTTPDHRCVTYRNRRVHGQRHRGLTFSSLEVQEAQDLRRRDLIPTAAPFDHQPVGEALTDAQVKVVAWTVTEGHFVKKNRGREEWGGSLRIGQNEGPKADAIRQDLRDAGLTWVEHKWIYPKGNAQHVYFSVKKSACEWLRQMLPGKQLTPALLMRMTTAQVRLLVDTMIEGDGSTHKTNGNRCFIQNPGATLETFQMALTMLGISYSVRRHGKNTKAVLLRDGTRFSMGGKAKRELVRHDGRVWCPIVSDTHTWMARRNGMPFITHNTFKTYSISYVELMMRMAQSGPEGRKAALIGMATLALMSGLQGLPGADDLDDLIDGAMQRLGYNFSSKAKKREALAAILGEDGARFVLTGLSGLPGAPIDVSGRLGLGNFIPGTGLLTKKDDYTRDALEVLGPAGSLAQQFGKAVGKIAEGEVLEGIKAALPVAAANAVKASDMASTGMYRDDRGRKVIDVDGIDAAWKAIGFQPNDVSRVQKATQEVQRMVSQTKMREAEIADKWARGMFEGDRDLIDEARDELARWNESNPATKIAITHTQLIRRVQAMRMDKTQRIAKTAPAEIRRTVREELERIQ